MRLAMFNPAAMQATQVIGDSFPKRLLDPIGVEYSLDRAPQRIVSLTLASDEILAALVPPERLIGVTYLADNPSSSSVVGHYPDNIARVRGEAESIISLQPDLVFVASYTQAESVSLLINAGILVVRLPDADSLMAISNNIRLIGQITDATLQAEQLIQRLHTIEQDLLLKTQRAMETRMANDQASKTLATLFFSPSGYSAAAGSLADEMLTQLGGHNVLAATGLKGMPKISTEMAIALQPEVILMTGWYPDMPITPAQQLLQNPLWQAVPAVKNQRVYDLSGPWSSAVSQFTWQALQQMQTLLYPSTITSARTQHPYQERHQDLTEDQHQGLSP